MAEHDEHNFEHEISERLKMLDEKIKIPEIPDAQGIFEKAEEKKNNAVPFKKYSRYIAAAAAVVLICVSFPVMAETLSGAIGAENAEAPYENEFALFDGFATADSAYSETDLAVESYEPDPESAEEPMAQQEEKDSDSDSIPEEIEASPEEQKEASSNGAVQKNELAYVLNEFFRFSTTAGDSAASSSVTGVDVRVIEENINKKRSIEITVEKDSVSIVIFDNAGEIINAFWVEGAYENSRSIGDTYIVNLSKVVTEDELENGNYLPMVGDANGTYFISEEKVSVPEKVTRGVISLSVEIDVGTGEYQIYASLV